MAAGVLRPFPQEGLEGCYAAANQIYAELSNKTRTSTNCIRA